MAKKKKSVLDCIVDTKEYFKAGMEVEQEENACLRTRVAELEAELDDWRNKEGSVCPEDVGFVEFIGDLSDKLNEYQCPDCCGTGSDDLSACTTCKGGYLDPKVMLKMLEVE